MPRSPVLLLAFSLMLPASARALDHSGDVSGAWLAADSPHRVVGQVRVAVGDTLVIEPGAIVWFDPGMALVVEGILEAGGPGPRVVMSAMGTVPPPGTWRGITFFGRGPSHLTGVDIRHARAGVTVRADAGLDATDVAVTDSLLHGITFLPGSFGSLENCRFERNLMSGVVVASASPRILGCEFSRNARPITLMGSCSPDLQALTASGNTEGDAVHVDAAWSIDDDTVWANGGLPFAIAADSTLTVDRLGTLALAAGVIVKFGPRAGLRLAGELWASGTVTEPCLFTSLADDAAAGDTNGDGAGTAPTKGDWDAIQVEYGGLALMQSAEIRLGRDGMRTLSGGRSVLFRCDVHHVLDRGLSFGPGAEGVVKEVAIHDCDVGVEIADATLVGMGRPGGGPDSGGGNAITCNGSLDVQNRDDANVLPALRNWWGAAGPDPSRMLGLIDAGFEAVDEPAPLADRRLLWVSRAAPDDVRLRWTEGSSCESVDLFYAQQPDGFFEPIGSSPDEELILPLASQPPGLVFYRVELD